MIIQIHAYIFNTSVGQFIVLINYLKCVRPIRLELLALFFTIAGQALMVSDPKAMREDGKTGNLIVYLLCLGSGLAGAGFFLVSNT